MVIFTLYFDTENVQKSLSEQYTENNTMMHKESMVYSFLIGHHKGKGICLESRYGQHMASTGNRTPDPSDLESNAFSTWPHAPPGFKVDLATFTYRSVGHLSNTLAPHILNL